MNKFLLSFLLIPVLLIAATPKLRVTYFMTNYRCHSCHYIENMTVETLLTQFSKAMQDSTIIFRTINIDLPENNHYVDDYKLEFKSIIIEKIEADSVISWNKLDTLWNCIDKDIEFSGVIERSVNDYLTK